MESDSLISNPYYILFDSITNTIRFLKKNEVINFICYHRKGHVHLILFINQRRKYAEIFMI